MDKYPSYLVRDLNPLVNVIGNVDNEPDIHSRLSHSLRLSLDEMESDSPMPAIYFSSVGMDHLFPEKKAPKEFPTFEGIIKYNWLKKHVEQLPSCVIYLSTFSVDWSSMEWSRREAGILDKYMRMKSILSQRECKIILILIKIGTGSMDKDMIEDRLTSLKRHLQIDSKSLFFIPFSELSTQSLGNTRKVAKSLKENISNYYLYQCKRIRNMEKAMAVNRNSLDMILSAKYNFKQGVFYEFLGQKLSSLKFYRNSYEFCVNAIEVLDEEWIDQVETVAEYNHVKILTLYLQNGSVKDAATQFKTHISKFLKAYSSPWRHFAWLADQFLVFAQLLDQYKINDASNMDTDRSFYYFNAARYSLKRQTVFENTVESGVTLKSIELKKQLLLGKVSPTTSPVSPLPMTKLTPLGKDILQYRGYYFTSPKFLGSSPQLYDPVNEQVLASTEETDALIKKYYEDIELSVDHGTLILTQLRQSLKYIDKSNKRRKLHVESLIADQYYKVELYYEALQYLKVITDTLACEGWMQITIPLLYQQLDCAIHVGDLQEILHVCLILYSKEGSKYLDVFKKEQLHKDIFFILNSASSETISVTNPIDIVNSNLESSTTMMKQLSLRNPTTPSVSPRSMGGSSPFHDSASIESLTTYIGVTRRPEYGSAAINQPCPRSLPNGFTVRLFHSPISSMFPLMIQPSTKSEKPSTNYLYNPKLFEITTKFHHSRIEIGQEVHVEIRVKSLLQRSCKFDEMIVSFCGKCNVIRFIHDNSCGLGDCDGGVSVPSLSDSYHDKYVFQQQNNRYTTQYVAPIVFKPNQETIFSFPIIVTESSMQKIQSTLYDLILFIETIDFLLIHQIPNNLTSEPSEISNLQTNTTQHEVILSIKLVPDGIFKSRDSQLSTGSATGGSLSTVGLSRPWQIKEIVSMFHVKRESLIQILKPTVNISLLYPQESISLLQGPLQRVNLVFYTDKDELIDGLLYLASDYSPMNEEDNFFWYPSLSNDSLDYSNDLVLDQVVFHPFQLNSSYQPAYPMTLSYHSSHSYVMIPLFIRSELIGQFKLRLRLEFISKPGLQIPLSKEYELKVQFHRPLQVLFNITSHCDALCGIMKEGSMSTVLRGDVITITSSLTCLDSLDKEIDIVGYELITNQEILISSSSKGSNETSIIPIDQTIFQLISDQSSSKGTSSNTKNLLYPKSLSTIDATNNLAILENQSYGVSLHKGESFINSVDISCLPYDPVIESSLISVINHRLPEKIKVSIGNICIHWKINDKHLLQPLTIQSFIKMYNLINRDDSNPSQRSLVSATAISMDPSKRNPQRGPLPWLPIFDPKIPMENIINEKISITRFSSMIFPIPPVQVIAAPFDVRVDSPTIINQYEIFTIKFHLRNKLWNYEKIHVSLMKSISSTASTGADDVGFLITGSTAMTYDIAPHGEVKIVFHCVPISLGQQPLPHVILTWDRKNSVIVDIGSKQSPRYVFVKPMN